MKNPAADNSWIKQVSKEYGFDLDFADLKDYAGAYLTVEGERKKITINERDKPYRQNFSGALEIARFQLGQFAKDELSIEDNNKAYTLAADIMIDAAQIKSYLNLSLQEIREEFPWCSHEVIARKILSLKEAVLTIWDRWNLTIRIASKGYQFPSAPQPFEIECYNKCREEKKNVIFKGKSIPNGSSSARHQQIECDCYYISETGNPVTRVVMFTSNPD